MQYIVSILTVCFFMTNCGAAVPIAKELKTCHLAWEKAKEKKYMDAFKLSSPTKCPLTHRYLQWEKLRDDGVSSSHEEYKEFIAKNPEWPWMPHLIRKAESAMKESTPADEVFSWFSQNAPRTSWGMNLYLKALKAKGMTKALAREVKLFWHQFDFTSERQKSFLKDYGNLLVYSDHKQRLDRLLFEQKKDQAKNMISLLKNIDKKWAQARLDLLDDHEDPDAVITNAGIKTPDMVFEHVRWLRRKDDLAGAHLISGLKGDVTTGEQWWRERSYFAREAFNQGDPKLAYKVMQAHPYKQGRELADAEWFCGWLSLRYLDKPERALKHFLTYQKHVNQPDSLTKASYWLGRTYDVLGKEDEAKAAYKKATKYKGTYYAMLARYKLDDKTQLTYHKEGPIDKQAWANFQTHEFVRLSRLLKVAGLDAQALPFLYLVGKRAKSQSEKRLAIELIQQVLNGYTIFATKEIGLVETRILPWMYPLREIDGRALKQGVDTKLMHAIIRQESGFHTKAVSPAGASGMMQVMPATAEMLAKKNGYQHKKACLTDNPDYNILLGSHYLKGLLERYEGSYVLTIAAYNAGPRPTNKWIENFGNPNDPSVDIVDWIESIPYKETRGYVKSVLANYYVYTSLAAQP